MLAPMSERAEQDQAEKRYNRAQRGREYNDLNEQKNFGDQDHGKKLKQSLPKCQASRALRANTYHRRSFLIGG